VTRKSRIGEFFALVAKGDVSPNLMDLVRAGKIAEALLPLETKDQQAVVESLLVLKDYRSLPVGEFGGELRHG
jgi:hypothetical protein